MVNRIGLDTGFFVRLLAGRKKAISVYEKIINGEEKAVISVIVVFELRRLALKGIIDRRTYDLLENNLKRIFEVVPLDLEIAIEASSISHGTGLHASDALIYTSYRKAECSLIYTTDGAFETVQSKQVKIEFI